MVENDLVSEFLSQSEQAQRARLAWKESIEKVSYLQGSAGGLLALPPLILGMLVLAALFPTQPPLLETFLGSDPRYASTYFLLALSILFFVVRARDTFSIRDSSITKRLLIPLASMLVSCTIGGVIKAFEVSPNFWSSPCFPREFQAVLCFWGVLGLWAGYVEMEMFRNLSSCISILLASITVGVLAGLLARLGTQIDVSVGLVMLGATLTTGQVLGMVLAATLDKRVFANGTQAKGGNAETPLAKRAFTVPKSALILFSILFLGWMLIDFNLNRIWPVEQGPAATLEVSVRPVNSFEYHEPEMARYYEVVLDVKGVTPDLVTTLGGASQSYTSRVQDFAVEPEVTVTARVRVHFLKTNNQWDVINAEFVSENELNPKPSNDAPATVP